MADAASFISAMDCGDIMALTEALKDSKDAEERKALANTTQAETTALYYAAQKGHDDAVLLLLENGADVNEGRRANGCSPLFAAAQHGHADIVDSLIAHGATIDLARDNGATPLFIAACFGRLNVVEALLDQGADVSAETKDPPGFVAETIAREQGHEVIAELLRVYGLANNRFVPRGREDRTR